VIRVLLCDDHPIVREGLQVLLQREPDLLIVGEASDGHEVLDKAAALQPDLVLLDLSMPRGNGVDAISRLRKLLRSGKVLVLSMHAAPEYVRPALQAGAAGYLVKGSGLTELLQAIRAVAAGKQYLGREAAALLENDALTPTIQSDDLQRLTPREREVLQLIAEGHTNREIAALLQLSAKTVDTHRTSLMRKLDLHDVQGLTRFAVRRGLITSE